MAEYGRIDVVEAGASVGGGLVVKVIEDEQSTYLDIEAEKLYEAVKKGAVSLVTEDSENELYFDIIVFEAYDDHEGYLFGTLNGSEEYSAATGTDKPSIDGGSDSNGGSDST